MGRICVLSVDGGVERADDMVIDLLSLALACNLTLPLHACMLPRCRLLLLMLQRLRGSHMGVMRSAHTDASTIIDIIFIFVEDGVRQQVLL